MISVLAVVFLFLIVVIAVVGTRLLSSKRSGPGTNPDAERCALCRKTFGKSELVLREVGDYKLLYFCKECILQLYADLGMKN